LPVHAAAQSRSRSWSQDAVEIGLEVELEAAVLTNGCETLYLLPLARLSVDVSPDGIMSDDVAGILVTVALVRV
jgi:hypothetical protein